MIMGMVTVCPIALRRVSSTANKMSTSVFNALGLPALGVSRGLLCSKAATAAHPAPNSFTDVWSTQTNATTRHVVSASPGSFRSVGSASRLRAPSPTATTASRAAPAWSVRPATTSIHRVACASSMRPPAAPSRIVWSATPTPSCALSA